MDKAVAYGEILRMLMRGLCVSEQTEIRRGIRWLT
jgi:hypothetical protein